jgi:hypothetical protein
MEERKPVRLGEGLFRQAGRCRTPRGVYYLSRDWSGRRAGDYFHQNKWAEAQKAESRKPYGARHDLNPPSDSRKGGLKRRQEAGEVTRQSRPKARPISKEILHACIAALELEGVASEEI